MNTTQLGWRLATTRQGMRGGFVLDAFAIGAYAVATFLAFTVGSGAWMFYQRWANPSEALIERVAQFDPAYYTAHGFASQYLGYAAVAVGLLVWPIISLGTSAAVLGARGRARSLATLRLLGTTSGQVMKISLVETLLQAAFGLLVGAALWLVSLPAWQLVRFMDVPIAMGEMLMPIWLILTLAAVLLIFAVLATVIAFTQVRVSPLGVSRRQPSRRLSAARVALFGLAVVALVVFIQMFNARNAGLNGFFFLAAVVAFIIGGITVLGPFLLQLVARPMTVTTSASRLLAARRIIDDPRAAWRNVGAIALLGLIATFTAMQPADPQVYGGVNNPYYVTAVDIRTGSIIAVAVVFIVAAASTTMNQASSILDRADESRTQVWMGMPKRAFGQVRRRLVAVPVLVALTVSVAVGFALAMPFLRDLRTVTLGLSNFAIVLAAMAAGVTLLLGASTALEPLQRSILASQYRRND